MYGKLNRSAAIPSSATDSQNPTMNGWSIPAPAPWPTTSAGPSAGCHDALTSPLGVGIINRSMRAIMVADGRSLLPRDVGLRLRRMAPRRLLPRGPEEGRHARLLLLATDLGRGQLHVPQAPLGEDDRAVARASSPGLRLHAEGQPADHPLEAARGRGGGRPRVRDDGQAARGPLRMRALPVP